jgi:hypothetical protein
VTSVLYPSLSPQKLTGHYPTRSTEEQEGIPLTSEPQPSQYL